MLGLIVRATAFPAEPQVLSASAHHLGVAGLPEWDEFADRPPHGTGLELAFDAPPLAGEGTLLVRQRDVKATWTVQLNGRRLGTLETLAQPLVRALRIPPGVLRPTGNRLAIMRAPSTLVDDIVVGEVTFVPAPLDALLGQTRVVVRVTEVESGAALPCRLTWVDAQDALMPLAPAPGQSLAVRTGVLYTGDGTAEFGAAPGEYVVFASRGFEYSVARAPLVLQAGETRHVNLQLRREVPTPGLIATDTHIHTLTHSRHGDATIDERMLTIAGEGIELAVATDHNHHADYTEPARRTGMDAHFRPVVGNEVTTKAGHFNAFPVPPDGPVPDHTLTDWGRLLPHIRAVTGAQVITLNHPRDVHQHFTPLGPDNFDAATGAFREGERFDFDAIEVVTSAAMQSDIMLLFHDWFALLNRGHRVAAIGSSDTHHVSEYILGQARTYVRAEDASLAGIDLEEVFASFRSGRLLVSFGLLTDLRVNDRFAVGDLATVAGDEVIVDIEVRGPSWVNADQVALFANGIKIREQTILPATNVQKARVRWSLPRPAHDVHLVAIASGPGVTGPFWEIPRPYQAASKTFTPRVLGATNPVWLDADGDGRFTSARSYAAQLLQTAAGSPGGLAEVLKSYDAAVAAHVADLTTGAVRRD